MTLVIMRFTTKPNALLFFLTSMDDTWVATSTTHFRFTPTPTLTWVVHGQSMKNWNRWQFITIAALRSTGSR